MHLVVLPQILNLSLSLSLACPLSIYYLWPSGLSIQLVTLNWGRGGGTKGSFLQRNPSLLLPKGCHFPYTGQGIQTHWSSSLRHSIQESRVQALALKSSHLQFPIIIIIISSIIAAVSLRGFSLAPWPKGVMIVQLITIPASMAKRAQPRWHSVTKAIPASAN